MNESELSVTLRLPAYDLTEEEKHWATENPDKANGMLASWYRHNRGCRRRQRRKREASGHRCGPLNPGKCTCAGGGSAP